jgi:hypothetical protein
MESFVNKLKEKGRHLVTIIDPHLSTNKEYEISQTLSESSKILYNISFNL